VRHNVRTAGIPSFVRERMPFEEVVELCSNILVNLNHDEPCLTYRTTSSGASPPGRSAIGSLSSQSFKSPSTSLILAWLMT
jgi:hypothetical protein